MSTPNPTEAELLILRILWRSQKPMTVRQVHETLMLSKNTAYTTVLKMLTIMTEKGLVLRDDTERSHTYVPVETEEIVQSSMLSDLMQRAFSGSALHLVQRALDNAHTSAEDLDAISQMIAQAKAKAKGDN